MPDHGTQRRDGSAITSSIGLLLVQAARAHRAMVGQGLAAVGLHPGQDLLLEQLWTEDGLTQSELTSRLRVEAPTVVKALQRLEQHRLVLRERDPQDGRVWRIGLTDEGRALRDPVLKIWEEAESELLAGLSERDQATARRLLGILQANMFSPRQP